MQCHPLKLCYSKEKLTTFTLSSRKQKSACRSCRRHFAKIISPASTFSQCRLVLFIQLETWLRMLSYYTGNQNSVKQTREVVYYVVLNSKWKRKCSVSVKTRLKRKCLLLPFPSSCVSRDLQSRTMWVKDFERYSSSFSKRYFFFFLFSQISNNKTRLWWCIPES